MNKLKVLLTILMGTLIAFSAQRAYYVKTGELSSIYSRHYIHAACGGIPGIHQADRVRREKRQEP